MSTTPPLIGLIGKKRSGKDTFASVLTDELGFSRVAFADPLRAAALALDPIIAVERAEAGIALRLSAAVDAIGWEAAKDEWPEVRRILQSLGTNSIRALDEHFWVRAAMKTVDRRIVERPVVVTDVRFPNEAEAIRHRGGALIRIVRPGFDGDGHPTETALDAYPEDYIVDNDHDVEALLGHARMMGSAALDSGI